MSEPVEKSADGIRDAIADILGDPDGAWHPMVCAIMDRVFEPWTRDLAGLKEEQRQRAERAEAERDRLREADARVRALCNTFSDQVSTDQILAALDGTDGGRDR